MKLRNSMVTVFVARPAGAGGAHPGYELLQLRRRADDYLGGTWQTVRGTIEKGETAVATALRELREEAGLEPVELYRIGLIESFYIDADDSLCHSAPFLAMVDAGAVVTMDAEHDAFRWVAEPESEAHFMWPSERPLLREIRHEILGDGSAKPHLLIRL